MEDLGGIFGDLFGAGAGADGAGGFSGFGDRGTRRAGAGQPKRGRDITYEITLSFEDALEGVQAKVEIEGTEKCSTCSGVGAKPGTSPVACPACGGTGTQSQSQGLFGISRPCPRCGGTGRIIEEPCVRCKGRGEVTRVKPLTVHIPAGVTDGGKIRFKGKGEPGTAGGPPGDLYVVTHVQPHPVFRREGADVWLDVPVSIDEAALGTQVTVPTVDDGKVRIRVKPGTQDGKVLTLKGQGAPKLKGKGRGDMKVRIQVKVPETLSAEQKELLKRFGSSRSEDLRAHLA